MFTRETSLTHPIYQRTYFTDETIAILCFNDTQKQDEYTSFINTLVKYIFI